MCQLKEGFSKSYNLFYQYTEIRACMVWKNASTRISLTRKYRLKNQVCQLKEGFSKSYNLLYLYKKKEEPPWFGTSETIFILCPNMLICYGSTTNSLVSIGQARQAAWCYVISPGPGQGLLARPLAKPLIPCVDWQEGHKTGPILWHRTQHLMTYCGFMFITYRQSSQL